MTLALAYPGDQTAEYDPATGQGLVGKVVGPDVTGRYRRVTQATYDPTNDVTLVKTAPMPDPECVLDTILGDDA